MNKSLQLMINFLPLTREKKMLLGLKITDFFEDFWFKTLNQKKPNFDLSKLPESIEINTTYDKKNDSFYAECTHLNNNIFTTSSSVKGLVEGINDLVYDFYDIPRFIARNLPLAYMPPIELLEELKVSKSKVPEANIKIKISPSRDYAGA